MKIICKIGLHKWNNYTQTISIDSNLPNMKSQILQNVPIRICKRCLKKQFNTYFGGWRKYSIYTKEENRSIQLKKILG